MTYSEAIKWIDNNLDRIGTTDEKGFIVDDLIIVPSEDKERDAFLRQYIESNDKKTAILPYIKKDMQVWAVDTRHIESSNILFFNILNR